MTGEQKPGGLSEAWRVLRKTFSDRFEDGNDHEIERMEAAVAAAEPAEARIRALEAANNLLSGKLERRTAALDAAEAKLARAVEGLEKSRDHFDFLTRMASGSAVFEIVDGKRIRRRLGEVIASEADEGSKHVRQTLAALQQEGE